MSGFDGRIVFEGDPKRCRQLLGVCIKHANVQRQNKNIAKLDGTVKTYDLGGGAYVMISDQKYMRSMHIVAPTFEEYEELLEVEGAEGVGGPGVYDVLAGYTHDPTIVDFKTTDAQGKPIKVQILKQFIPTHRTEARYPDPLYRQRRLAVQENPIFTPIGDFGDIIFSEHAHCKPTNYTGLMRHVVQLIMGLGKVLRPTAEENMKLPGLPPIGKAIIGGEAVTMNSAFGLYGHHEEAWTPRVDFDYRSFKTHSVVLDSDKVAWVIEIAPRGVHAMKLYMDPVSTTVEGRARWIQVSPELEDFFGVFSGIPLGLTLPTFELFDKFKRAGEVIELISEGDMRDFYSKSTMSNDTGWCFSEDGVEAHNTCWTYGEDQVKRGYHFAIGIQLNREVFKPWTPARAQLAGMFHTVYEVNKCRRMSESDAEGILRAYSKDAEAGAKAFDELVVKPTLQGTARMALQRSGKLYHPARFKAQPQIKFPESFIGGLLSFDFSPGDYPIQHKVKCDTPMYVFYVQGKLDVINYAYDNTKDPPSHGVEHESTRGQCQNAGTWTETTRYPGSVVLLGNFYSNRWDFRSEYDTASEDVTTWTGTHLGAHGMYGQDIPGISTTWSVWTVVDFFYESTYRSTQSGPFLRLSVALPMHDRCAAYMAMEETQSERPGGRSGHSESAVANIIEQWHIYNFIFAWFDSPWCPQTEWVDQGPLECWARKRCVSDCKECCLTDYEIGDFFLEACPHPPGTGGNWVHGPPWPGAPYSNVPGVELPSSYSFTDPIGPGHAWGDIHFVNNTPHGEILTKHERNKYDEGTSLSAWWWKASPDDDGNMAMIKTVSSCLGASISNLMDDIYGDLRHLGGPEYMWAGWFACYTGVIE